jgi:c-di-GMP-binding flagellar brake protein YcgR
MLFSSKHKDSFIDYKASFNINDSIKLEYRGRYHSSRVEDIGDDCLHIAWPAVYGSLLRIKEEDSITVISSIKSGMHGFRVQVRNRVDGPRATLEIVPIEDLGRVQRRNFARVPEMIPVWYRVVEPRSRRGFEMIETISKNISGGGMLMAVDREKRPFAGDVVEVHFDVPGGGPIHTRAEVIRVDELQGNSGAYEMAIRFMDVKKQDQNMIVKRVFAKQAELRKAGLL